MLQFLLVGVMCLNFGNDVAVDFYRVFREVIFSVLCDLWWAGSAAQVVYF